MNTPRTSQKPLFEDQKQVRVTVPVAPDVLDAFQRLASVSGMSTGKAMGEWLSDTMEGVRMMTELLEKAKQAPKLAARELHAYAQGLTGLTSDLIEEIKISSKAQKDEEAALRREGGPDHPVIRWPALADGLFPASNQPDHCQNLHHGNEF